MDVVKFGVLGGTFDPIHNGHLAMAEAAKAKLNLSKIIFVPAGIPPHKSSKTITPTPHRVKMLQLALTNFADFSISMADINRVPPHYSVDMLPLLQSEYGFTPAQTYFIIGVDLLTKLSSWYHSQQLLNLCNLAVVHRPGYALNLEEVYSQLPNLDSKIHWIENSPIPISSTEIRHALRHGQPIEKFVPPPVLAYIRQENLYQPAL